eukprot:gene597-10289_t
MVSNISGMEDQTDVLEPANGENAMDQYLQSIGLYRKPVAKDGSCLFRAVAEKVYLTQARHLDVRRECIQFMKSNSELFRAFVPGSFEHHLFDLQNPKEWAGQVEITALSMLYKHDFIVYQEVNQPPQYVTANGYKDKIELCFSNGNHYDFIYPKSFKENAAVVQSMLYSHLYDIVFPECEKVDNPQMETNTTCDASPEEANKQVEVKTAYDKESSGVCWELKRSMDPTVYRNVALEVWENSKQDQTCSDKLLASKLQYRIGEYCLLSMSDSQSADESFKVRIDSICEKSLTYYVWIPDLNEYTNVSVDRLRPLLEKPEKIAQIAYDELPGFYNKSDESSKDQTGNFQYPKKRQKGSGGRSGREDENKGKRFDVRGEGKPDGKPDGAVSNRRDNRRDRRGRGDRHEKNSEKRGKPTEKGSRKPDVQRVTSPPAVSTKTDIKSQVNEKVSGAKKPVDQEAPEDNRPGQEYPLLKSQEKEKTAKQHESAAAFWQRINTVAYQELQKGGPRSKTEQTCLSASEVTKHIGKETLSKLHDTPIEFHANVESGFNVNASTEEHASSWEQEAPVLTRAKSNVSHVRDREAKPKENTANYPTPRNNIKCAVDNNPINIIESSGSYKELSQGYSDYVESTSDTLNNEPSRSHFEETEPETEDASANETEVAQSAVTDTSAHGLPEGEPYFSADSKVLFPSGFDEPGTTDGRFADSNNDESNAASSPITFMSSRSDISASSDESSRLDITSPVASNDSSEPVLVNAAAGVPAGSGQSKSDLRNEQRIRILKKDNKDRLGYFSSPNESSSSIEQAESLSRERSPEPDSKRVQSKKVSFGEVIEISQISNEINPYADARLQAVASETMHNPYANANGLADSPDQAYFEDGVNMGASMGMPTQLMPVMMHNPMPPPSEPFHFPQGFSVDLDGKDLPNHMPTLRFFYNLGLQYFCMQHQFVNMPVQQLSAVQVQPQPVQGHMSSPIPAQRFATAVDPASHFNQEQVMQAQQEDFTNVSAAPPVHYDFISQQSLNQSRQHHPQAGHQNSASQYEQPPRMRRVRGRGVQSGPHLSISRGYNVYNQSQHQYKPQSRVGKRGGFNMNTGSMGTGHNQSYQFH